MIDKGVNMIMEYIGFLIAEAVYHWARLLDKLGLFPDWELLW